MDRWSLRSRTSFVCCLVPRLVLEILPALRFVLSGLKVPSFRLCYSRSAGNARYTCRHVGWDNRWPTINQEYASQINFEQNGTLTLTTAVGSWVEEIRLPRENHRRAAENWSTFRPKVPSDLAARGRFEPTTRVVRGKAAVKRTTPEWTEKKSVIFIHYYHLS